MGDTGAARITVLRKEFNKILSKHEINNGALLDELVERVQDTWGEEHPRFEIGDGDEQLSKEELEVAEEVVDIVDADASCLRLLKSGKLKHRDLEKTVSAEKAVIIRRKYLEDEISVNFSDIPFENYDWQLVKGACCENPIGYVPIPLGMAGPIRLDNEDIYIPIATSEGALVASISRGCKAVSEGNGVQCIVKDIGMTRAPYFSFKDIIQADHFVDWINDASTFNEIKSHFERGSSYCKLKGITPKQTGSIVSLRFVATTGDAMGMNMVSKGCEHAATYIKTEFPDAEYCISSNLCTDKKAAAVNWIKGRGKKAISSVVIKADTVERILHTTVDRMEKLNIEKNLEGSSMAVTIGGNNAQAANVVAAVFLATGQDPAQVVCSHMCMTTMKKTVAGDLQVECTMECLEVGTVGGGTILAPQKSALKILNCAGSNIKEPGQNACRLAKIICAAVLAGEVSLIAALCTQDLVRSHLTMNRSAVNVTHANTESDLIRAALTPNNVHPIHNASVANVTTRMKNALLTESNLGPASPCFKRMKPGGCANLV